MDIVEKFLKYVSFETTSDEESNTKPSSDKEIILLEELQKELKEFGLDSIYKNGAVYSFIKSDCGKKDAIFLMAHVDTAPDASGKDVKPEIVKYVGEPIKLKGGRILSREQFINLDKHIGSDLIVTDGNTLLGADDKAGIAIIMQVVEEYLKEGNYPNIIVCFSSDEEIGRGPEGIDIDLIKNGQNTVYGYTVDGGDIHDIEYECFNAASAKVTIEGVSVHPGDAKNKLINASEVLMEFHNLLPKCRPQNTEKREGFIHMTSSNTMTEIAHASYILRSFDKNELNGFKEDFIKAQQIINDRYQKPLVSVKIADQYQNMYEVIEKNKYVVELVEKAYKNLNIELHSSPIRGGTDGATLSFMGLPCPNLATGGENYHGVYEYLDINHMKTMVTIIKEMMKEIN